MNRQKASALIALTVAAAAFAPTTASADAGAAVAAGIGGFALGAIAGGALAQPAPPPPVYYAPAPAYAPVYERCWRERRPVFDEYGDVVGFRRQRVCE
jgi:hypothetical protein